MTRLYAALLLALTFVMIWTPAHASFPAGFQITGYRWNTSSSPIYSSMQEACDRSTDNLSGGGYGVLKNILTPPTGNTKIADCDRYRNTPPGEKAADGAVYYVSVASGCPANSTQSGAQCTCNASSWVQEGSACISAQAAADKTCKALADGLNIVGAPLLHYGPPSTKACFGGYEIKGSGGAGGSLGGAATQSELYGPFSCSGANALSCSVVPKPSDITAQCEPGSFPGQVNGLQVCLPPTNTVQQPKTTTSAPPTPGGTAPSLPGTPAGTVESTEQTGCTNGTCTTTTTNKDASGASTGTTTRVESQADYCARSPTAPGCDKAGTSTFSGACSGGFTFKGDAIQGAIAKEIHQQNCLMNAVTAESALYDAAKAKTGDQTTNLPGNQTVAISSASFNTSNALGPASCITDLTIDVLGSSVVLPISSVCPWLGKFRLILLAVAFFIAYRIVFRS